MAEKKLVLMAVLATSFVVPFMGSAINLAVPAMGDTFGVNPASLSWVVSSYILASVSILLPIFHGDFHLLMQFFLVGGKFDFISYWAGVSIVNAI